MKFNIIPILTLAMLPLLPITGNTAELGTRQQTVIPLEIPAGTPTIYPSNVSQYVSSGYGGWNWGPGTNQGTRFDLMPANYPGATNAARLLSFFSMSDIHITDKESPAQLPYMGWSASFGQPGPAGLNPSSYSPILLSTTHVLDAAVKTVNALHRLTPFDCGIVLGDNCNAGQYNELRWFIDVMDGQPITPSSGNHLGATNIDYQMPYQATGLDPSIPWYEAIGNHDQFWMGVGYPTDKIKQALVGTNILNISTNNPLLPYSSDGTGMYVGVIDGSTPYGNVISWGQTNLYATTPTVAADTNRHSLTTDVASPTNYVNEFFNTTTLPAGHGFNRTNTGSLTACYTFEPLANLPLKVIVLDDTCKSNNPSFGAMFYGGGWIDVARLNWLTNELQQGQDSNQLMILACHIPICPQTALFNTNPAPAQFYDYSAETNLMVTLHQYPNLILLMAGHRHLSTVTPQPSPDAAHPEYGFWEVETPSLRDFPQQFRTWEILRNTDNNISILTTDVDPVVETNTPAGKSRGYAIGAARIFNEVELTNTSSHTYNAELLKPLTLAMQTKIAAYGRPLGHRLALDSQAGGVAINFLGKLQSADTLSGMWTDVTNISPYMVSATNTAKFYRATEDVSSNSALVATDYSITGHWLAIPTNTKPVDVFYLYPTAWTDTNSDSNPRICAIDNPSMLTGAASAYARQATVFSTVGNIYAPYYRQDNLSASNREAIIAGIPTMDATAAFDYYINHLNMGRPFILAGHSQGSDVLNNLLSDYMKAHPEVLSRMVAAYVIGFSITPEYLANNPHLKFATGPDDTGVIISYNTEAPDVAPGVNPVLSTTGIGLVINPISWSSNEELVATNDIRNLGTSLPQFLPYADAKIDQAKGVLVCAAADEDVMYSLSSVMPRGVYHSFDYLFYYYNLRANATNRVAKFLAAQP